MMTQCRNVNIHVSGSLQDSHSSPHLDLAPVNGQIYRNQGLES
jgi:hypothetical protein